tara:strand:- start:719 stop:1330 length:612 start_codon:yes stop_codon:yes gene_type:complete
MYLNKTPMFVIIILITAFLTISLPFARTAQSSETNQIFSEKWSKTCRENNPENCLIAVKSDMKSEDNKSSRTIAYAYIELGSKIQKEMSLIDAQEKTFKLGEKRTDVPVLFIDLPLNLDLRIKPILLVDDKQILELEYITCHNKVGCKSIGLLNAKQVQLFKKGKTIDVFVIPYGNISNKGFKIKFPLKGFTKSYNKLASSKK